MLRLFLATAGHNLKGSSAARKQMGMSNEVVLAMNDDMGVATAAVPPPDKQDSHHLKLGIV